MTWCSWGRWPPGCFSPDTPQCRLTQRPLGGLARAQCDDGGRRCLLDSPVPFVAGFVQLAVAFPGLGQRARLLVRVLEGLADALRQLVGQDVSIERTAALLERRSKKSGV